MHKRLPARCKKEAVAKILQAAVNLEQRNKKLLRPWPTGTYRCQRRRLRRERELLQPWPTGTCISNSVSPTKAQLASKSDAVNFQTSMLASSPPRCTGGTRQKRKRRTCASKSALVLLLPARGWQRIKHPTRASFRPPKPSLQACRMRPIFKQSCCRRNQG